MGNFNWEIWGKKGLKKVILGAIIGGAAEGAAFLSVEPVPTEYLWAAIVGIELIEWFLNAIKHATAE